MSDYTEILRVLLEGHRVMDSPKVRRFHTRHVEIIIGIGDDETATLTMPEEAYNILLKK